MEPEGLYRIRKGPPPVPIQTQTNPVHASPSHSLKIHFDVILPSTPGYSNRFLSSRFPHQNPVCNSPLPPRATCPAYLILLDLITRIIFGEECCLGTGMRNFSFPSSVLSLWIAEGIEASSLVLPNLRFRWFVCSQRSNANVGGLLSYLITWPPLFKGYGSCSLRGESINSSE